MTSSMAREIQEIPAAVVRFLEVGRTQFVEAAATMRSAEPDLLRSPEAVEMLRSAAGSGALGIAITNTAGSPMTATAR